MESISRIAMNAERMKVPIGCHMEAHIRKHHNILEEREECVNCEKENCLN